MIATLWPVYPAASRTGTPAVLREGHETRIAALSAAEDQQGHGNDEEDEEDVHHATLPVARITGLCANAGWRNCNDLKQRRATTRAAPHGY